MPTAPVRKSRRATCRLPDYSSQFNSGVQHGGGGEDGGGARNDGQQEEAEEAGDISEIIEEIIEYDPSYQSV